jgi:hypothetical protein
MIAHARGLAKNSDSEDSFENSRTGADGTPGQDSKNFKKQQEAKDTGGKEVKWTFTKYKKYFEDYNLGFDKLFSEIYDIIAMTLVGCEGSLCDPVNRLAGHRSNCFE